MRFTPQIVLVFLLFGQQATAQDSPSQSPSQETQTEDQKAAEVKTLVEKGRARQRATDRRNMELWERWTYAVCLGCGWTPKNVRLVHTHPLRVLAGIPAADDDARERAGKPI